MTAIISILYYHTGTVIGSSAANYIVSLYISGGGSSLQKNAKCLVTIILYVIMRKNFLYDKALLMLIYLEVLI